MILDHNSRNFTKKMTYITFLTVNVGQMSKHCLLYKVKLYNAGDKYTRGHN